MNPRAERALVHMSLQDPLMTSQELCSFLNFSCTKGDEVSDSLVRRYLIKNGLRAKIRPRKWFISKKNKEERVNFATICLNTPNFDFQKVIFSDESQLECGTGRRFVRTRTSQEALIKFPIERESRGMTVKVWGAIFPSGRKLLTFFDGNLDSERYRSILEVVLLPYIDEINEHEYIFQQDNAPCHRAKDTLDFLEKEKIDVLPWPSQSPDLNLIENLWSIVKRKLKSQYRDLSAMKSDIRRIWEAIDFPVIKSMYDSIPYRLQYVIRTKGGPTAY
jgi:transposase